MPHRIVANKFKEWFTTGGMLDTRRQLVGYVGILSILSISYYVERSFGGYILGIPAAIMVTITSIARAHDMREDEWDLRSVIRRMCFLLGVLASARYCTLWALRPNDYPDWGYVIGLWAWAGTLFTTPHLPPWWAFHDRRKTERS